MPDILGRGYFDRYGQAARGFRPSGGPVRGTGRFWERTWGGEFFRRLREVRAVVLPQEVVNLAHVDSAHQESRLSAFALREERGHEGVGWFSAIDPFQNRPRTKHASLHARAPASCVGRRR